MPLNHSSGYAQLTDAQFTIIGKIAVEWSNIESLMKMLLSRLLLTPEYLSRTYSDCINAAKVQDAIDEAVQLHKRRYRFKIIEEETLERISTANKQITRLRSERNKFAHFCWCRRSDEEIFGTSFCAGMPGSKKHERGTVVMTVGQLDDLHRRTYAMADELISILATVPEISEDACLTLIRPRSVKGKNRP